MMEKKMGLFTESDLTNINAEVKEEESIDVSGNTLGWALATPCFIGGGAVAAGGFAAAGV